MPATQEGVRQTNSKATKPAKQPYMKTITTDFTAFSSYKKTKDVESEASQAGTVPATVFSEPVKNRHVRSSTLKGSTAPKVVSAKSKSKTSPSTSSITKSCVPFNNTDGVSCYANAILQCLLQHTVIRSVFIASRYTALRDLSNSYNNPSRRELLSSRGVRRMLGAPFCEKMQQDASEFLISLSMYCRSIENCLKMTTRTRQRCTNCFYSSFNDVDCPLLPLTISEASTPNATLRSLFARMQQWEEVEGSHCTTCNVEGAVYEQSQQLVRANDLIVVQLNIYIFRPDGVRKINISVDDVTSFRLQVQDRQYRVSNIVCHHGPSATSGHYTSYHKQDRGWILANDSHITLMDLPTTDKDVYILFFSKD